MDHHSTKNRPKLKLQPGDIVEVRSFAEISTTLADDGTMAGLPFQPEMHRYGGN